MASENGNDKRGRISAGSYDLNKWLFGGYEKDVVSAIYGGSGTGKTNFCLLAAVSQAKKGNKVVFIDTEGGFSVERVKQMCNGDLNPDDVLKNIFLLKPVSFDEQKKVFDKLHSYLKDQISLIVVDGMTILYRLDLAQEREKSSEALQAVNSELARQMRILAEISRKNQIPVLITNQVYSWENEMKIVGGDIMRYWAKCWIELTNKNGNRTAFLRKHRSMPEKELEFQITNSGIKKRGWL